MAALRNSRWPVLHQTEDLYASVAEQYARYRPHYPTELFHYLSSCTDNHELALDIACGSGQASYHLAEYYDEVVATDISSLQLEQARKYHSHPKIEYHQASAETVGTDASIFPESVDLITIATAFHWLDKEALYAQARNLLKTNGILAHWTYTSSSLAVDEPSLSSIVNEFVQKVSGSWPSDHFGSTHSAEPLSPPFSKYFVEIEVPVITMKVSRNLEKFLGYVRTWSAIPRFIERYGFNPVIDLENKIKDIWGHPATEYGASQNLFLKVFRKV